MRLYQNTIASLRCLKEKINTSSIFGARLMGCFDCFRYLPLGYNQQWALNGQIKRQYIFAELIKLFHFSAVIETGTHIGTTTLYLHKQSGLPVYSAESDQRRGTHAKIKLLFFPKIRIFLEESKSFLEKLTALLPVHNNKLFFYLDAHWEDEIPIKEELTIIFDRWKDAVVMVDDFAVPDDSGYACQKWSKEKTLCVEYIKDIIMTFHLTLFFPLADSKSETGHKQGCVVLARDQETINALKQAKTLKTYALNISD